MEERSHIERSQIERSRLERSHIERSHIERSRLERNQKENLRRPLPCAEAGSFSRFQYIFYSHHAAGGGNGSAWPLYRHAFLQPRADDEAG